MVSRSAIIVQQNHTDKWGERRVSDLDVSPLLIYNGSQQHIHIHPDVTHDIPKRMLQWAELVPAKDFLVASFLLLLKVPLFRNTVFADIIKVEMRSYWVRMGSSPRKTSIYKMMTGHTGKKAWRQRKWYSCKQGMPRISRCHQKLGKGKWLFPRTPKANLVLLMPSFQTCHFNNWEKKILLLLVSQVEVFC